ncbi:hypothetical protein SAMN02745945_02373 [Peptoclostridium litorale DSM 5388]|uniref:Flagellar hook-length control protein-like C-terminal domain-containing protein n=1 Tax=Peptoclostridium litorale DSM 5388 TaxID=1121324 RepID=A0A069RJC2_PEPLI|nr:DUF6240 domain-containing protein [Peptoclostridium litorale]KDR94362.1 hypothetical protein CLIT_20c00070 [Peptoclostridium litorale DSM 5388]SIO25149.1 hypothetical protein SAMN02745945_02373 [Peptoclostridium litorale DSM 5388]
MMEKVLQGKVSAAADAYTALTAAPKIRGTLIEKDEKNIKIDMGDNTVLEAQVKEEIDSSVGEVVLIDRKNIVKSKLTSKKEDTRVENGEKLFYFEILKKHGIEASEYNLNAAKELNVNGVDLTRENIQSYAAGKVYLDEIAASLDYDSAIKLAKMDVDIENASLQEIAISLEELKEEKEGFSILKMFGKKEITTEKAESIAKRIYGSSMGKDITDIIKSLHKRNVNITKKNIEKINDVFYKLDKLQYVENSTFIDTLKNKLDVSIGNLYNIKRFVKKGSIESAGLEQKLNLKGYAPVKIGKTRVTEKELRLLKEDIVRLLGESGFEASDENIKISKDFIKSEIDITKENITGIKDMKSALSSIIKNLDRDKAAQLVKEGVDIEKVDIREIAKKISLMEKHAKSEAVETDGMKMAEKKAGEIQINQVAIENKYRQMEKRDFKEASAQNSSSEGKQSENTQNNDIQSIKPEKAQRPQNGEDIKPVEQNMEAEYEQLKSAEDKGLKTETKNSVEDIIEKVEMLKKIDEKDLLTLIKKNVDFKISKIEKVLLGKNETSLQPSGSDYSQILRFQTGTESNTFALTASKAGSLAAALKNIGELDFNVVAFQMKNQIPMTIKNIESSSVLLMRQNTQTDIKEKRYIKDMQFPKLLSGESEREVKRYVNQHIEPNRNALEVAKALVQNGLGLSRSNIQRAYDVYGNYMNVRGKLSAPMVLDSIVKNIDVENMDIDMVSKYVDKYEEQHIKNEHLNPKVKQESAIKNQPESSLENPDEIANLRDSILKRLVDDIGTSGAKRESTLAFLIKNKRHISLGELQKTYSLVENKGQLGHKVSEIINFIDEKGDMESREKIDGVKNTIKKISKSIRESNWKFEKEYADIEEALGEIESSIKLSNEEESSALKRKFKELSEKMQESQRLSRESKIYQIPVYMNEQLTNLNMYFRDRKKGLSRLSSEDMSVVLSIETENLGNVNMNIKVDRNNVNVKIGLENEQDKGHIENYKDILENLLEKSGYSMGEISFYDEGNAGILDANISEGEEENRELFEKRGVLDLKI